MDSLQHLSAAERECLMYLEETIDSLDVDEDSGLSNDEPETSHQAAAIANHLSKAADQSGEGIMSNPATRLYVIIFH